MERRWGAGLKANTVFGHLLGFDHFSVHLHMFAPTTTTTIHTIHTNPTNTDHTDHPTNTAHAQAMHTRNTQMNMHTNKHMLMHRRSYTLGHWDPHNRHINSRPPSPPVTLRSFLARNTHRNTSSSP
jgi:hypothetical protein